MFYRNHGVDPKLRVRLGTQSSTYLRPGSLLASTHIFNMAWDLGVLAAGKQDSDIKLHLLNSGFSRS